MKMNNIFDANTCRELEYYIYALIDPTNNKPFYIGKGRDNRVFAHVNCEINDADISNLKYDEIRRIKNSGNSVKHIIIRHGIREEKHAYEIEASLIDFLKYLNYDLTNVMGGHHSIEKGLMSSEEIFMRYNAERLDEISSECIIININRKYPEVRYLGENAIYEATRGIWVINLNQVKDVANNTLKKRYVLSEYQGVIVEVFEVTDWIILKRGYNKGAKNYGEERNGVGFVGHVANDDVRKRYIYKTIAHKKKRGEASPVKYKL